MRRAFCLRRSHLGDETFVKDHAADDLDVEMAHVQHAPADLADHHEHLRKEVVERFASGEAVAELSRLRAQRFVAERLNGGFERIDLPDNRAQAFQFSVVLGADDLGEEVSGSSTGWTVLINRPGISPDSSSSRLFARGRSHAPTGRISAQPRPGSESGSIQTGCARHERRRQVGVRGWVPAVAERLALAGGEDAGAHDRRRLARRPVAE